MNTIRGDHLERFGRLRSLRAAGNSRCSLLDVDESY
jgi:hypothetical protein